MVTMEGFSCQIISVGPASPNTTLFASYEHQIADANKHLNLTT